MYFPAVRCWGRESSRNLVSINLLLNPFRQGNAPSYDRIRRCGLDLMVLSDSESAVPNRSAGVSEPTLRESHVVAKKLHRGGIPLTREFP
jgi:hypothetical protein